MVHTKHEIPTMMKSLYLKLGRVDLLIGLALFFVTLSMSTLFAIAHHGLNVFDESVHFDYVYKVTQGDILPVPAQTVSSNTVREVMCRPSVVYPNANCSQVLTAADLPGGGVNYVLSYAPVYYWPVALLSILLHAILGTSWFISARLSTALLFSVGVVVFYIACRRYSASRISAAGVTIALASCPMLFAHSSTVNPDSLGMLAGAVAALIPTLKTSWRQKMIIATCAGIIIALIKSNLVPLGCVAILLAGIMPRATDKFSLRKLLYQKKFVISLCLSVIPLIAQVLWTAFESSRLAPGMRSDGFLMSDLLYTTDSPLVLVLQSLQMDLNPLGQGFALISSSLLTFIGSVISITILGGSATIAYSSNYSNARIKLLALAGIAGILLTAIYTPLALYVAYHSGGTQARYAIPSLVLMAIPVALAMNGKLSRWIPLVVGFAGVIIAVFSIA